MGQVIARYPLSIESGSETIVCRHIGQVVCLVNQAWRHSLWKICRQDALSSQKFLEQPIVSLSWKSSKHTAQLFCSSREDNNEMLLLDLYLFFGTCLFDDRVIIRLLSSPYFIVVRASWISILRLSKTSLMLRFFRFFFRFIIHHSFQAVQNR